ncbi:MAG: M28 family peptidase [Vicinamibacterales bacterium]
MTRTVSCLVVGALATLSCPVRAQYSPLLPSEVFVAIRGEASGERPLVDFNTIVTRFSGFAPSKGGDQIADYIAGRMRTAGLDEVAIEGFPADGRQFVWAFLTEPSWEAEAGTLELIEPRRERLADFAVHRVVLGRFSSSADITTELVDIGNGTLETDYEGRDVRGKLVLASGEPGAVHARAVWEHGAAGIVWFNGQRRAERRHAVSNPSIVPWTGPRGEAPGFAFALSNAAGAAIRESLERGQRHLLHASVRARTEPGEYKQVSAAIRGTDPSLREVWIKAHDNYRNTGGGNNLTGVGATLEMARVLQALVASGTLTRPRRTIRFVWSAEHYGSTYQFYAHPDWLDRILALLNVDMTGFDQSKTGAVMWLYRLPHSLPHFLSDVSEEFLRSVGRANSEFLAARDGSPGADPVYAPTGSRDQMHYAISDFWGPSDHEDLVEGSLRVPAVMYNDWPDPYLGTEDDDLDKADATQMRRSILTVAATAYYLATVDATGVPTLVPVSVGYGQQRLAGEGHRASVLVDQAPPAEFFTAVREAENILRRAIDRETVALESVGAVGRSAAADAAVARGHRQLVAVHDANLAALNERARERAAVLSLAWQQPPRPSAETRLARLVVARLPTVRGPVNIFRYEYGAAWLAEKTGHLTFLDDLAIARAGRYVWYEAINFVDGRRSILEIRDLVSAEYGPVPGADLEQYFRFLERAGVVSISSSARPDAAR